MYFGSAMEECPVYDREAISAGSVIEGPAILQQLDSTVVLEPGDVAQVHEYGSLIIAVGEAQSR